MRESALLAAVAAVADSIRRHKLVGIGRFGGDVGWMAMVSCVRVGLPVQTGYHKAERQIGTYVPILCRIRMELYADILTCTHNEYILMCYQSL
mgnify:FL=1